MYRANVNFLLAAGLYSLALLAQSAPARYPGLLVEAKVVQSNYSEQAIDFEVVVQAAPDGDHKTLRLSGDDGTKILLWPGDYYRVIEYGGDSASLEYLSPQEIQNLFLRQSKKKRKR
jgi:hypothetical protein